MDWQLPLLVSAIVFALVIVWRFRPKFGPEAGRPRGKALAEAEARVEAATDDAAKAAALADAADVCLRTFGQGAHALSYFHRAMRAEPASVALIERAVTALSRRPRTLETLLWRRLGGDPWRPETAAATRAALHALVALYDARPLRNALRARALERLEEYLDRQSRD